MINLKQYEQIQLKDKEIISYLRRGKGSKRSKAKPLSSKIKNRLTEMKSKAKPLIEAKALYDIFDVKQLPFRACFEEAEKVAIAIVSIGYALPLESNKLMKTGELVDGVILDAIGSAGVEEVADLVNEEINQKAKNLDLNFSRRFSPGYCQWDVKDQQLIFQKLPGDEIEVHLTDSYLMSPIKSISFAVNFGTDISNSRWENRCKYCEIGDCTFRLE